MKNEVCKGVGFGDDSVINYNDFKHKSFDMCNKLVEIFLGNIKRDNKAYELENKICSIVDYPFEKYEIYGTDEGTPYIIYKSINEKSILFEDGNRFVYAPISKEIYLFDYNGKEKDIILPKEVEYNGKIERYIIRKYALTFLNMESIKIPIELDIDFSNHSNMFEGCKCLKKVVLPIYCEAIIDKILGDDFEISDRIKDEEYITIYLK